MDDDFRSSLERRLATLRGHRDLVQEQLRDLHHELNSLDRRVEAAEELYRREFAVEPPQGKTAQHSRRATRIRRREMGQPSWRDGILKALDEAGHPLHAREIWESMEQSGFQTDAADPLRSVVATAIRTPDRIQRVGPNTFALNGTEAEERQLAINGGVEHPSTNEREEMT